MLLRKIQLTLVCFLTGLFITHASDKKTVALSGTVEIVLPCPSSTNPPTRNNTHSEGRLSPQSTTSPGESKRESLPKKDNSDEVSAARGSEAHANEEFPEVEVPDEAPPGDPDDLKRNRLANELIRENQANGELPEDEAPDEAPPGGPHDPERNRLTGMNLLQEVLRWATENGYNQIVALLERFREDFQVTNLALLDWAIGGAEEPGRRRETRKNYVKIVRWLIEELQQQMALLWAAENGYLTIMWTLIEDLEENPKTVTNLQKQTALVCAAQAGQTEVVEWLLDHYFPGGVNCLDENGFTLLHRAARGHSLATVELLVDARADLGATTYGMVWTALHLAAREGSREIVNFLVQAALDQGRPQIINQPDRDGQTPLHLAAIRGNVDIVRLLIRAMLTLLVGNQLHQEVQTALQLAAVQGRAEIVRFLLLSDEVPEARRRTLRQNAQLTLDATINAVEEEAASATRRAAWERERYQHIPALNTVYGNRGHAEIIRFLIEDLEVLGHPSSALHWVIREGYGEVARLLIATFPLHINRLEQGYTPLDIAIDAGDPNVVNFLIGRGARVNQRVNPEDDLPPHWGRLYFRRAVWTEIETTNPPNNPPDIPEEAPQDD